MARNGSIALALPLGAVVLALVASALVPAPARAHPLLDQAQERFQQADFEGALELYAQAEAGDDLTRDDLVQLYLRRALVHHAVGNDEDLQLDLDRLATLEPQMELGRQIPPRLRRAFEEAAAEVTAPLSVEVDATPVEDAVRLSARVQNDRAALVREVHLSARGDGDWESAVNDEIVVTIGSDGRVLYFAELVGPGGAVIASAGSRDEPRVLSPDARQTAVGPGSGEEIEPDEGGVPWWPFVVGGAVAAAGAVALILLLAPANDQTDVGPPQLMGTM